MKHPGLTGSMLAVALLAGGAGAARAQETVLYAFGAISMDGDRPYGGLIFDGKGNLYGITVTGGTHSNGTVFELIPEAGGGWTEKVLYNFGDAVSDGQNPYGGVIFDKLGNLYGTTDNGGTDLSGTVFELSPQPDGSWKEQMLYSFKNIDNDGNYPQAGLILDGNGNLYGTTSQGGDSSSGTVFEVSPQSGGTWTEQVLHSFSSSSTDGTFPEAGLIFDGNGNLYGTTSEGGSPHGPGTVFELTQVAGGNWNEQVLHSFGANSMDGIFPEAGLIFDGSGNLYGTTQLGGAYGALYAGGGTVFELTPAVEGTWTEKILYSFGTSTTDGQNPYSGVVFDGKGNLYGATEIGGEYAPGGTADGGTAFKLTPVTTGPWTETVLHSFGGTATDGDLVRSATLLRDAAGNLYGTTSSGGSGDGTVFEVEPIVATASTPVFSVRAGTYSTAQKVKITDATPGAVIHYTTDKDTPTSSSATYTEPIEVPASETLQAIAVATGYADSAVATARYVIEKPAAKPVFSPAAGKVPKGQSVKIADETPHAMIHYTTNGATPTAASKKYTAAITVSAAETIKAIAIATGYAESTVASAAYTLEKAAATPVITPDGGTSKSAKTVKITDATARATIYYTVNGKMPTTASAKYTKAFAVSKSETVEAIAIATGYSESAVASAKFTID
ncbi:MAG: choice-of-anchor tandem repeat GloVer-containing protein [Terracidiphilus sp.]